VGSEARYLLIYLDRSLAPVVTSLFAR
jgi:hypothetical protein